LIDAEVDGQPNAAATGDDLAGAADEDGVQFPDLTIGQTVLVRVSVANAPTTGANLFVFFDWNRNGTFDEPGESLPTQVVHNGLNDVTVSVPASLTPNLALGARFRLSTTATLSWFGSAPDGEVEDYLVTPKSTPTAATLSYFRANAPGQGTVRLEWGTLVEIRTLGFYVEREEAGSVWRRVGTELLPALGYDRLPHRYQLVASAPDLSETGRYRLVEVELDGQERILAVTQIAAPVAARLTWKAGAGLVELRGTPNLEVMVETAALVNGPWREVGRVVMDRDGLGSFGFDAHASDPARFFRIVPR
jgi:hypothetical protein